MDYRELENRMARNRDLIKERAYDRIIAEAKKANKPQRVSWFTSLRLWISSLKRQKVEAQPQVQIKPQRQLEVH